MFNSIISKFEGSINGFIEQLKPYLPDEQGGIGPSAENGAPTIFDNLSDEAKEIAQKAAQNALVLQKENCDFCNNPQHEGKTHDDCGVSWYLNEDGTIMDNYDEIFEGSLNGIDINKHDGYVEIDYDGDGKYDQQARYDSSGKKIEEWFDSNSDGKLDTGIGYDADGNATWVMADTNYDGNIDFSE